MNKKIIYVDMDNVLVDFPSGISQLKKDILLEYKDKLDEVSKIFSLMIPMPGALEAIKKLAKVYDLYILTTSPWNNPTALQDKLDWIKKYFGNSSDDIFHKKVIFSHHKNLLKGDYLIDDRTNNGAGSFEGELIQFQTELYPDWESVTRYLLG
jgi:5'(3')-deoxyribonucleotidase